MNLPPPYRLYLLLPFLLLTISTKGMILWQVNIHSTNCGFKANTHKFRERERRHVYAYQKYFDECCLIPKNLTLNSSNVKFTRQTPHHGSIAKSTGCVGKSSFAIDLFSFHIIFWMTPKYSQRQEIQLANDNWI